MQTDAIEAVPPEMDINEAHIPAEESAAFSGLDIFPWLSADAADAVESAARRRRFGDRCWIYLQSELGDSMYRIVSGAVRLSILRRNGRESLHLLLQPGDCFGFFSLLDGAPRHLSARASGSVELQVWRRDTCESFRRRYQSFDDALMRLMSSHLRILCECLASFTLDELPGRVALRLLKFRRPRMSDQPGETVPLSQSELAVMVGASRQAVNKVLQAFVASGWIETGYGGVRVLNATGLQSAMGL